MPQTTETYNSSESQRKQLESQIKELVIRIEEAEMSKDGKKPLAKLQARVATRVLSSLSTFFFVGTIIYVLQVI